MTRSILTPYDDAVLIADILARPIPQLLNEMTAEETAALERFADALDEAEARLPSGLFPRPVIIGPTGEAIEI